MVFPKKIDLGGYDLTFRFMLLVQQSSPNFFRQRDENRSLPNTCPILDISSSIPEIFAIKLYSRPKSRQILHV